MDYKAKLQEKISKEQDKLWKVMQKSANNYESSHNLTSQKSTPKEHLKNAYLFGTINRLRSISGDQSLFKEEFTKVDKSQDSSIRNRAIIKSIIIAIVIAMLFQIFAIAFSTPAVLAGNFSAIALESFAPALIVGATLGVSSAVYFVKNGNTIVENAIYAGRAKAGREVLRIKYDLQREISDENDLSHTSEIEESQKKIEGLQKKIEVTEGSLERVSSNNKDEISRLEKRVEGLSRELEKKVDENSDLISSLKRGGEAVQVEEASHLGEGREARAVQS